MQLADLQRAFWLAVRTRGEPPKGLDALFTPSARQTAAERLAVYHHAYWRRQLTVLAATFPRTQAVMSERFERIVFAYVEARPCREPCIERLGAGFVQYLLERDDVSPVALGTARLEWASTCSLLAPDADQVAELPRHLGERFVDCSLVVVPSLYVEHVPRSALRAFLNDETPTTSSDATMTNIAFFRPELSVRRVELASDEASALALATGGASIAVICSAFSALPEAAAATRALTVLSAWFTRRWITTCQS